MIANSHPTNQPDQASHLLHMQRACTGPSHQELNGANMPQLAGSNLRPTSHMYDLANLQPQQQQQHPNLLDDATSPANKCDHLVSHGNHSSNHSSNHNSHSSSSTNSSSSHNHNNVDMSRLQLIANNHGGSSGAHHQHKPQVANDMSLYSPSSSTSLLYHVYDQINVPSDHQYQAAATVSQQQQQQQQQQEQQNFKRSKITFLNPANLFASSGSATMAHHHQQHAANGQAFVLNNNGVSKTTIPQQELYSSGTQFLLQQPSFSGSNSSSNHSSNTMHNFHHLQHQHHPHQQQQQQQQPYGLDNQHQLMLDTILRQQHAVATSKSQQLTHPNLLQQQQQQQQLYHNRPLSSSGASSMSGQSMALTYGRQPRQANLPPLLPINSSKGHKSGLANVLQSNYLNGHFAGATIDSRGSHEYGTILKFSVLLILLALSLMAIVKFTLLNDDQAAVASSQTPTASPPSQKLASFNQFQNPYFDLSRHNSNMYNPALNYPPPKIVDEALPAPVFDSPPVLVTAVSPSPPVMVKQQPMLQQHPHQQQRPTFYQQPVQQVVPASNPVNLAAQPTEVRHVSSHSKSPSKHQQATQPEKAETASSDISNNRDNNNIRGCRGHHCPAAGCPNQCSQRGQCVKVSTGDSESRQPQQGEEWRCQCPPDATGEDCSILIERQCGDGLDNDNDGLVDCQDSECCSDPVCDKSYFCLKSKDPLDILLKKQPPPPTSSFYQRMQFLIEDSGSQSYGNPKYFNDSRASVLRGRVMYQKQGVMGVRVAITGQINLGITLTREGGYFDLLVNGGGAVTVEFQREPFAARKKTIRVPWNEIVLMDSIELELDSQANRDLAAGSGGDGVDAPSSPLVKSETPICSAHKYRLLRPQIVAAPSSIRRVASSSASRSQPQALKQSQQVATSGQQQSPRAVISRDSGVLQHAITLPQTQHLTQGGRNESVSLVYVSSRANEFTSPINIQLTPTVAQMQAASGNQEPPALSKELKQIHLKIIIEGILFERSFEPELNLNFTYAWNRRNVYRQKSFGLSTASVSVGYEYVDCKQAIWSTKHLQLSGHELPISDIGDSWNLNIHYRYNYRESILQRGDGQNINLRAERPRVVLPVMGDGYQRQAICPFCDGAASPSEQKLFRPQALVSAPDGSLYIGDHNLVRRIEPAAAAAAATPAGTMSSMAQSQSERVVRTVLELAEDRVPANGYALALNLAPSAGDQQLQPRLYMTDSTRRQVYLIREQRSVAADSTITNETTPPSSSSSAGGASTEEDLLPVAGNGAACEPVDQMMCGDGQSALSARLIEPKALAFDLAGRMYLVDGPNVRLVDLDQKIYTILGNYKPDRVPSEFPCSSLGEAIPTYTFVPKSPRDLAINPIDETLHVLDDNVVYKITQDKRIQVVAGRPAHCRVGSPPTSALAAEQQVAGATGQPQRATEVYLQAARSIAFNQNGNLFISEDFSGAASRQSSRVFLVSLEDDTISLHAGLPGGAEHPSDDQDTATSVHRISNALHGSGQEGSPRASDFKFHSVSGIALDQLGVLLVADKSALRVVSIEPDLPQITKATEHYEIQSPDNPDELLVFNRHGHHLATRELAPLRQLSSSSSSMSVARIGSHQQRQIVGDKYTFGYDFYTALGHLAAVNFAKGGNKITINRDGKHNVRWIETEMGVPPVSATCKPEIVRPGLLQSLDITGPLRSLKMTMVYKNSGGGLLEQFESTDGSSRDLFKFSYDEFGRALSIQH